MSRSRALVLVPLVLVAACSSGSKSATPTPSAPSSTATASPSASPVIGGPPTVIPGLPIADAYEVLVSASLSTKELDAEVTLLGKMTGVVGVSVNKRHLRVDLTPNGLSDNGAAVVAEMRKLGTVYVP